MSTSSNTRAMPHVSVVIPTKERREFLRQAISSVRAQDYKEIDLLVAYGPSTDGTLEFLVAHDIPFVTVENPGIGSARTAGLASTTGEILYFLDDDDLMEPTAVSTLVNALLAANADVAYGTVVNFLDASSREEDMDGTIDGPVARFNHVGTTLTSPINSSTIVRRSAFETHGPMDDDNHSWARWYLHAVDQGMPVVRIENVIAQRRIHDTNVSRRAGNYDKFFQLIRLRHPENADRRGRES